MDIGPQSESDNKTTASCRLKQSQYRANILKEDFGFGPTKNSKKKYGNMLAAGETTGSNFITTTAFGYAQHKVLQKKSNKALTIDEFRLFNNMLSSMPMCFNLFSDLRELLEKNPEAATSITKQLFSEISWINTLMHVDVEFIPVPIQDYTNDKSAFDAMILVNDSDGNKGLISIETKYTDVLGSNVSSDSKTKSDLIRKYNIFDDKYASSLARKGYKQIHRNYLLTVAYTKKNNFKHYVNVVISPESDRHSIEEIQELQKHLTGNNQTIIRISLEEFTERGLKCGNGSFSSVMERFRERYLL